MSALPTVVECALASNMLMHIQQYHPDVTITEMINVWVLQMFKYNHDRTIETSSTSFAQVLFSIILSILVFSVS